MPVIKSIHSYRLPTGTFKNKPLEDIPSDYLRWWLRNLSPEASPELIYEVKREYHQREEQNRHWYGKSKWNRWLV